MDGKNICLEKTSRALKELSSALSECSQVLNEKKINAGQKEAEYQRLLGESKKKEEMLTIGTQNAIACISELAAKIDNILG